MGCIGVSDVGVPVVGGSFAVWKDVVKEKANSIIANAEEEEEEKEKGKTFITLRIDFSK